MANPFDNDAPDSFNAVSKALKVRKNLKGRGFGGLTSAEAEEDDELNVYQQQIAAAMKDTLESTQRSKGLLNESEEAGIRTAENLVHQREQLENTNRNLDSINATTTQTQRHLNNIKSVFGGLRNKFSRKSSAAENPPDPAKGPSKLEQHVAKMDADTSGFYGGGGGGAASESTLPASTRAGLNEALQAMDREVDDNLDDMSAQLRRLQGLGAALGSEIEEQNQLLDDITVKADATNTKVRDQDRQMKRILGVKPGSAAAKLDPPAK